MKDYWANVEAIERNIKLVAHLVNPREEKSVDGLTKLFTKFVSKYFGNTESVDVRIGKDDDTVYIKTVIDGEEEFWTPSDFSETMVNSINVAAVA